MIKGNGRKVKGSEIEERKGEEDGRRQLRKSSQSATL